MAQYIKIVSALVLGFLLTALAEGFKCRLTAQSIDILLNHPPFCSHVSPGSTLTPVKVLFSHKRSRVSKSVIHN